MESPLVLLTDLPKDIQVKILLVLGSDSVLHFSLVCHATYLTCQDNFLWYAIIDSHYPYNLN